MPIIKYDKRRNERKEETHTHTHFLFFNLCDFFQKKHKKILKNFAKDFFLYV